MYIRKILTRTLTLIERLYGVFTLNGRQNSNDDVKIVCFSFSEHFKRNNDIIICLNYLHNMTSLGSSIILV